METQRDRTQSNLSVDGGPSRLLANRASPMQLSAAFQQVQGGACALCEHTSGFRTSEIESFHFGEDTMMTLGCVIKRNEILQL